MTASEKEQLFLRLLEANKTQIHRICWGFSKHSEEAEDLFQEVLLLIWKGLDGYQGKSAISTWVYRITVNTCLYWKKKKKKMPLDALQQTDITSDSKNVEEQMIYNDKMDQLKKAIQQLNEVDRTIALLLLESVSYKEIAEITGLTTSNVGVKISRIKKRIKEMLEEVGVRPF